MTTLRSPACEGENGACSGREARLDQYGGTYSKEDASKKRPGVSTVAGAWSATTAHLLPRCQRDAGEKRGGVPIQHQLRLLQGLPCLRRGVSLRSHLKFERGGIGNGAAIFFRI